MPASKTELDFYRTVYKGVPVRLRQARKLKGYTIEQASRASGISTATIERIELGLSYPTVKTLLKLAWAYDCVLSEIMK